MSCMNALMSKASLLITREFFFFSSRRRHTRLQGDWSSDVCSSDLILALFVAPALQSSTIGIPTDGQMTLLVGALALILAINAAASVVLVAARLPGIRERPWAGTVRDRMFPPMVPIVATVLEYLHGVDLSSMRFAYVGTFLAVPVALSLLYTGWRLFAPAALARVAAPAVVGTFVAAAGIVVTHGSPYLDGPRSEMTATFSSARLEGMHTVPA